MCVFSGMLRSLMRQGQYFCHECGKSFSQPSHLRTHMRSHTGKYSCNMLCESLYNSTHKFKMWFSSFQVMVDTICVGMREKEHLRFRCEPNLRRFLWMMSADVRFFVPLFVKTCEKLVSAYFVKMPTGWCNLAINAENKKEKSVRNNSGKWVKLFKQGQVGETLKNNLTND